VRERERRGETPADSPDRARAPLSNPSGKTNRGRPHRTATEPSSPSNTRQPTNQPTNQTPGATPRKSASSPSAAAATTPRRRTTANTDNTQSKWLAANPSKRWTEVFFLAYSPFWIAWALGILVPFKLYDRLDEWGYLAVGLAAALPCFLLPLLVLKPCPSDARLPLLERHWVKANLWIAIFSHIGNYFWTHYFFNLLGAAYTLPSHRLNGVSRQADRQLASQPASS
jgi:hypothetical protein